MKYKLPDDPREFVFAGGTWMQGDEVNATEVVDSDLVARLSVAYPEPVDIEQQPAPVGESKADKFRRLAVYRMDKALERITQLGHLSNRSQYEYTAEQVEKMRATLQMQLDATFNRFQAKGEEKDGFSF
jgi:hypothetical protein